MRLVRGEGMDTSLFEDAMLQGGHATHRTRGIYPSD